MCGDCNDTKMQGLGGFPSHYRYRYMALVCTNREPTEPDRAAPGRGGRPGPGVYVCVCVCRARRVARSRRHLRPPERRTCLPFAGPSGVFVGLAGDGTRLRSSPRPFRALPSKRATSEAITRGQRRRLISRDGGLLCRGAGSLRQSCQRSAADDTNELMLG